MFNTNLAYETQLIILSHLEPKDLFQCAIVNKKWEATSNDKRLWKSIWEKMHPNAAIDSKFSAKEWVVFCSTKALYSWDEVENRFKNFLSNVPLDKECEFSCEFPYSNSSLTIKIGYQELNRIKFAIKEKNIFIEPNDTKPDDYKTVKYQSSSHQGLISYVQITYPQNTAMGYRIGSILKDNMLERDRLQHGKKTRMHIIISVISCIIIGMFIPMAKYFDLI